MIGTTTSQTLDLTLINKGDMIYGTSTIKVEIGLKVGSTIEYIPMGIYNIDDIEKTDYTIKITAFDNMIKFERNFSTNLGENLTLQQVVSELERITGVQFTGSLPSYTVKKLEGFTCREILGYVASLCGGNAVITREGKFTIVTPNDINYSINTSNYFDYKREETKYKIGKISCQVGEEVLSKGILGTDSMELQFENPWVTNSILQDIYNKLNGFEYLGYSMKWQGDLSLDLGDIVTITDKKGVVRKHPILSQKFNYTGGLTSEISAKGENKNKNEFSSSGSTAKKVERVVMELALINKALIDVAYIGDLTAGNIKFDTASGNTLDLQTLLSKFVTGENGQFLNLTTDNVTISNAVIKDIIAKNISVEDLKAGTINTNNINLVSADGGLSIVGPTMQFKDKNNKVRLQLGQDTEGDFNFILRAADGTTTLIDGYGIKEKAIADKLIKSNMVADKAIGEQQINYSSLITGLNKDTNTSLIKASKVALDLTGQTLEVSFNSLKSVADDTKSKTESNTTSINAINGQIATLIIDTTIEEDGATVKLKDSYSNLKQTVSGINATIASHSTSISNLTNNLNAVSGKVTTVNNKVATIETSLNSITSRVSSTENSITTINGNISSLQTRMSTAEQKITDSAIINTVSSAFLTKNDAASTYATKSSLIQTSDSIIAKFSSSGYNLLKNSAFANNQADDWWFWGNAYRWEDTSYYKEKGDMWIANHSTSDGGFWTGGIPIKPNTKYTFSVKCYSESNVKGGRFFLEYQSSPESSVITYQEISLNFDDVRHSYTFTTPNDSSIKYLKCGFKHHGVKTSGVGGYLIKINKPCLAEGEVSVWSPNPFEIKDGATMIDANGVTIYNGAITVKNNAGQIMLQGDGNGNLSFSGRLQPYDYQIRLFGNECKIDGSAGAIRMQWDSANYVSVGNGAVRMFNSNSLGGTRYMSFAIDEQGHANMWGTQTRVKLLGDSSARPVIQSRNISDNAYGDFHGADFLNRSTIKDKTNVQEINDIDFKKILMENTIKKYNLKTDVETVLDEFGLENTIDEVVASSADIRLGFILEELTQDARAMLSPGNMESISIYNMCSILWKVCQEQQKRIEALENLQ